MASAATAFEVMANGIRTEFAAEGATVAGMTADRQFDPRCRGQAHELTVTAPANTALAEVTELFEAAFARGFGRRDSSRGVELVNLRLVGRIPIETPAWTVAAGGSGRPSGQRRMMEPGASFACDVWARGDIQPGTVIPGPAVIEEMSATTYLPTGWTLSVGAVGEMQLRRSGYTNRPGSDRFAGPPFVIASRTCGVAIQGAETCACRPGLPRRSRLAMTGASRERQVRTSGG